MINSVSGQLGSINSYYNTGNQNPAKIEVPVPSNVSIYAQFKHVRGVPASANQEPVSLSKAQIINNMVSFLNNSSDEIQLNNSEEFVIEELEQEVHRVVNDKPINFNSLPGKSAETGIIFNLTA
ncbi:MAG: hypothetical protein OCD02_12005 [Spirochaetaceae bacterium]